MSTDLHFHNGVHAEPPLKKHMAQKGTAKPAKEWAISSSHISRTTLNPIREVVDKIKFPPPEKDKPIIKLSLGDPSVYGNLDPPQAVHDAVVASLKGSASYAPSCGLPAARDAIAAKYSTKEHPLATQDVFIASGGSGAIVLAMQALASPGDNVLIPRPGFALYLTVAGHSGFRTKFYDLDPEKSWQVDLKSLEAQIDDRTRAICLNNPSNPCGANYSKEHLLDILALAEKYKVPIISDEIYERMVYPGQTFYPLAELSTEVPILTIGGLAKHYCVPGWRVGWVCVHDRKERFGQTIRSALMQLTFLTLGASTAIQHAIPAILKNVPSEWTHQYMGIVSNNGKYLQKRLSAIPGLQPIEPQGALYLMVKLEEKAFKGIEDDRDFTQKLLDEEQVMVLPGACFASPGFVRLVCCAPESILAEAMDRLARFCKRYGS